MRKTSVLSFVWLISLTSFAQPISGKESKAINNLLAELSGKHKPGTYLIRNVSILTMKDSTLLQNHDVLVEDGKIQQVGQGIQSKNATVIDGTGKFLMPGLTDMHVHLMDKHPMKNTWSMLLLLHGVTSVRDLLGEPEKLVLRERIKANEILAPNLYQSGRILNSVKGDYGLFEAVTTPEQGREFVASQKKAGYDGIKVYDGLSKEVYLAIVDEATKQNMMVDGHLPWQVPLSLAIESKQNTVEHLYGYFEWKGFQVSVEGKQDAIPLTAGSTLWNCPTIYNHYMNGSRKGVADMLSYASTTGLIPSGLRGIWTKRANNNSKEVMEAVDKYGSTNFDMLRGIVLNLYKSNARLIAGTDAGSIPFLIPGYSLHQELTILADLGIPVYDALKMTTINAAMALRKESEFGTVEVGKRADLLLLNANPLSSIKNLQGRAGVMVRGIWLDEAELKSITERIRLTFAN